MIAVLALAALAQSATVPLLPPRRIDCTVARITNFDPSKDQKPSEFVYEGNHVFSLFLPPIPVRTTEPPGSTEPPEPVDPRTQVLADPDGLLRSAATRRFDRVVDYWPDRVELTRPIDPLVVDLIILDGFDPQSGTINLFLTQANDAVTYDQTRLYSGRCKVTTGRAVGNAAR